MLLLEIILKYYMSTKKDNKVGEGESSSLLQ